MDEAVKLANAYMSTVIAKTQAFSPFPFAADQVELLLPADQPQGQLIQATNDVEAIAAWLREYKDRPDTFAAYRKESERFLLWVHKVQRLELAALRREHFLAYRDFMCDPQPRSLWCGPPAPRHSPKWRPFTGPLSSQSADHALRILNGLMNYLVDARYLSANPLTLSRRRRSRTHRRPDRFLDRRMLDAVLQALEHMPRTSDFEQGRYERTRFLFIWTLNQGPRASELARATMGSVYLDRREGRAEWWWRVRGKGGSDIEIPVLEESLEALVRYRRFRSLLPYPTVGETEPLVAPLRKNRHCSFVDRSLIYRELKSLFREAATIMEDTDPGRAARLRAASTHWLRHTTATRLLDRNVPIRYVSRFLRHADLRTTAIYAHEESDAWRAALEAAEAR